MKQLLLITCFFTILFTSCNKDKNNVASEDELKKEIQQIEQATEEIDQSTKKLDDLLNEL